MSEDELSRVRARVQKLLRLSESSNAHEAANAAAVAQALLDRYRLDRSEVEGQSEDEITVARKQPLEDSRRIRTWKVLLAQCLARHNGCRAFLWEQPKPSGRGVAASRIIAVGTAVDIELTQALYAALRTAVEVLTRRHGQGRSRDWCDSFRTGVVAAIDDALSKTTTPAISGSTQADAPSSSLPSAVPAGRSRAKAQLERVDAWIEARQRPTSDGTPKQKGRRVRVLPGAHDFGRFAGASIVSDLPDSRGAKTRGDDEA